MPRAPSQKSHHASASGAGHPYPASSFAGSPSSSAQSEQLSHPQHTQHQQHNSAPHMHSLPPHSSSAYSQQQQNFSASREESGESNSNRASPTQSPHVQAQSLTRYEGIEGGQKLKKGNDTSTKAVKAEIKGAESARVLTNGNSSPTGPEPPSASSSTSGSASAPLPAAASMAAAPTNHRKKHVCTTCDRAFTTSGHLARHARVHTGERNHKCPFPGCETRCSRQDNLQQHYRIHLSPGSRRSSAVATRAAIQRAISNPDGSTPIVANVSTPTNAMDLDAPPPLAQATMPAPHLAQAHAPYPPPNHQPYSQSPQMPPLSQAHMQPQSPIVQQVPYPHSQSPPLNGNGVYANGNGNQVGTPAEQYGHSQPESPVDHSTPPSAAASVEASPVIGAPSAIPPATNTYPGLPPPAGYVYHQYYPPPPHQTSLQGPGGHPGVYPPSAPPPQPNGQYQLPPPPQISSFYQQHHYPPQAYATSTPLPPPPQSQTPPSYPPHPSQPHEQQHQPEYVDQQPKSRKRRSRSSGDSLTSGAPSPGDSPNISDVQGQSSFRQNGHGQSNVYAYYGMAAPPSSGSAPPPSSTISNGPSPPSTTSNGRYTVNGNGSAYSQFQLHTPPPNPPPLTSSSSSSGVTSSSSMSYTPSQTTYSSQSIDGNGLENGNGNGTHSPPPILAPIQTKRSSYQAPLPRYYQHHPGHTNGHYQAGAAYASVGKGYVD